jgi:hypothetical protein
MYGDKLNTIKSRNFLVTIEGPKIKVVLLK